MARLYPPRTHMHARTHACTVEITEGAEWVGEKDLLGRKEMGVRKRDEGA